MPKNLVKQITLLQQVVDYLQHKTSTSLDKNVTITDINKRLVKIEKYFIDQGDLTTVQIKQVNFENPATPENGKIGNVEERIQNIHDHVLARPKYQDRNIKKMLAPGSKQPEFTIPESLFEGKSERGETVATSSLFGDGGNREADPTLVHDDDLNNNTGSDVSGESGQPLIPKSQRGINYDRAIPPSEADSDDDDDDQFFSIHLPKQVNSDSIAAAIIASSSMIVTCAAGGLILGLVVSAVSNAVSPAVFVVYAATGGVIGAVTAILPAGITFMITYKFSSFVDIPLQILNKTHLFDPLKITSALTRKITLLALPSAESNLGQKAREKLHLTDFKLGAKLKQILKPWNKTYSASRLFRDIGRSLALPVAVTALATKISIVVNVVGAQLTWQATKAFAKLNWKLASSALDVTKDLLLNNPLREKVAKLKDILGRVRNPPSQLNQQGQSLLNEDGEPNDLVTAEIYIDEKSDNDIEEVLEEDLESIDRELERLTNLQKKELTKEIREKHQACGKIYRRRQNDKIAHNIMQRATIIIANSGQYQDIEILGENFEEMCRLEKELKTNAATKLTKESKAERKAEQQRHKAERQQERREDKGKQRLIESDESNPEIPELDEDAPPPPLPPFYATKIPSPASSPADRPSNNPPHFLPPEYASSEEEDVQPRPVSSDIPSAGIEENYQPNLMDADPKGQGFDYKDINQQLNIPPPSTETLRAFDMPPPLEQPTVELPRADEPPPAFKSEEKAIPMTELLGQHLRQGTGVTEEASQFKRIDPEAEDTNSNFSF